MTWAPNVTTKEQVEGFVEDLMAVTPEILGIDETIPGCEVIDMDPYTVGVGTLPRYLKIEIREYYQDVLYRGGISGLSVGDFVSVTHFREGNRYEVTGAGGAGGSVPGLPFPGGQGWAIISDAVPEWVATATPTWFGAHTFNAGLVVGAGQGITLPDPGWIGIGPAASRLTMATGVPDVAEFAGFGQLNIENVLGHIGDADTYLIFSPDFAGFRVGNVDMLQMDEDGVDIVTVNPTEADVDFRVCASGITDALFVQGNTGYLGIGAAPDASSHIYTQRTAAAGTLVGSATTAERDLYTNNLWTDQATRFYAAVNFLEVDLGAASAERFYAGYEYVNVVSNDDIARVEGRFIGVRQSGTGTIDDVWGVQGYVALASAGDITNVTGVEGQITVSGTGGIASARALHGIVNPGNVATTIGLAYGVYVQVIKGAAATITTGYGVYIVDVDATTSYGIYQAGADDDNYFAGDIDTGGDFSMVVGKGIVHASGVVNGEILLANGTRYVPSGWFLVGTAGQTYTFPAASGTIPTGTGANTQVTYWTGVNTIAGDAGMTYVAATDTLTVGNITVASGGEIVPVDAAGQDLGDATHWWDLYTQNVYFEGGTGTNIITIPDNAIQALIIRDDTGGWGYLEFDTSDAPGQAVLTVNPDDRDIDFVIKSAVGGAGAFFINGATAAITIDDGPSMTIPAAWNLIVPDNVADAFGLDDVGGLEYMRIVSTDANPYFLIDPAAAGIKVGIGTGVPAVNLHLYGTNTIFRCEGSVNTGYGVFQGRNSDGDECGLIAYGRNTAGNYFGKARAGQSIVYGSPNVVMGIGTTTGVGLYFATNNTERASVSAAGAVKILSLAGAGVRAVVAAADGTLSAP